jgi:quercetin 2,3-dioxygenase
MIALTHRKPHCLGSFEGPGHDNSRFPSFRQVHNPPSLPPACLGTRSLRLTLFLAAACILTGCSQSQPPQPTPSSQAAPPRAEHHFVKRGAGKMYPRDLVMTELKLSAEMTDGRYTYIDEIWNPGFSVQPHFHVEHCEVFYVLDGQVEWTVNGETHLMGAGDLVYIPPDTVHSVKVIGQKDMRTLMIYQPGGHEDHLEEEQQYTPEQRNQPEIIALLRGNYDFNPAGPEAPAMIRAARPIQASTPARQPAPSVRLLITAPQPAQHRFDLKGQGEMFRSADETSEVKLAAVDTDGRFSFLDEIWKPGMTVPPHYHKRHAETFYVVSGQVEWSVNGETHVMGAGDLVYIPPDTVHSVKVIGAKDVQSLMLYEPGGYEYHARRETLYSPEQLKQPEISGKLHKLNDFNPVTP